MSRGFRAGESRGFTVKEGGGESAFVYSAKQNRARINPDYINRVKEFLDASKNERDEADNLHNKVLRLEQKFDEAKEKYVETGDNKELKAVDLELAGERNSLKAAQGAFERKIAGANQAIRELFDDAKEQMLRAVHSTDTSGKEKQQMLHMVNNELRSQIAGVADLVGIKEAKWALYAALYPDESDKAGGPVALEKLESRYGKAEQAMFETPSFIINPRGQIIQRFNLTLDGGGTMAKALGTNKVTIDIVTKDLKPKGTLRGDDWRDEVKWVDVFKTPLDYNDLDHRFYEHDGESIVKSDSV